MSERCCDVVIHINEVLNDEKIHSVEKQLSSNDGIYSACVHQNARHLMVVDYNPLGTSSWDIQQSLTNQGLHTQLIGL